MMVMTAKVDIKKVIAALAAVAGVIVVLILLLGGIVRMIVHTP